MYPVSEDRFTFVEFNKFLQINRDKVTSKCFLMFLKTGFQKNLSSSLTKHWFYLLFFDGYQG